MRAGEVYLGKKGARIKMAGFSQNLAARLPRAGNRPSPPLLVGEVVIRLRDRAHGGVRPEPVGRAPLFGMPALAVVLPIVITAGDDLAARADLWSIKSFHGTTYFPPAVIRPEPPLDR